MKVPLRPSVVLTALLAFIFWALFWWGVCFLGARLYEIPLASDLHEKPFKHSIVKHELAAPLRLSNYMERADFIAGRQVFSICARCHVAQPSQANGVMRRVGPNLWGVVGRPAGTAPGFRYSKAFQKSKDKIWDLTALDHFITDPSRFIPGTIMSFSGIKDPQRRADLLLYLQGLSDETPNKD